MSVAQRQPRRRGARSLIRLVRPAILLVDSDMRAAEALAGLLRHDFTPVVVVPPEQALEAALAREFAIVLVVQRGPGLNGMKLLARVRRRWGRTRGFIVAGYADMASVAEAIGHEDASDYLFTPFDTQELARVLRDAARQYLLRRAQATVRQQELDALRESEQRYRALVEQAPDGILVADHSGRCVEANLAASELLGRPTSAILGRALVELVPALGAFGPGSATARWRGSALVRADGSRVTVDVAARRLADGGLYLSLCPTD